MRRAFAFSACIAAVCGNAFGVQLPLGFTEAPSCGAAYGGKSRPVKGKATQKVSVKAIVEGENTEQPANAEPLQACANAAAKKIDLRLLAAQTGEGNALFKNIFLQCVEENQLPVSVYFVALKLEDNCEPDEMNGR